MRRPPFKLHLRDYGLMVAGCITLQIVAIWIENKTVMFILRFLALVWVVFVIWLAQKRWENQ